MFIVKPSLPACPSGFSLGGDCHSEYEREMSSPPSRVGMRRTSSNLSQLSAKDSCLAPARQIELELACLCGEGVSARVSAPTGESALLHFNGHSAKFAPIQPGCGHGTWNIDVIQGGRVVSSTPLELHGVGSLFFTIGEDLTPRLSSQEFLVLPGSCCHKH